MIKPINSKTEGCSPVSSSCVYWQGKDIPCIKICDGDTIDDVIGQLGCLICDMKSQLDVAEYDLACLGLNKCDQPVTFKDFINLMIGIICQLQEAYLTGEAGDQQGTNGESTVTVASCFQSGGITQTISQYLQAIGQKVCEQEIIIQNQQNAILQLQEAVAELQG
jgi:hypothetical protein